MWDLGDHARAITRIVLSARSPAMLEVIEQFNALGHDVMRFTTLNVHHKTDAACVMFVARVVKPLALGHA